MYGYLRRSFHFILDACRGDSGGPLLKYEADDVMNPLEHRTMADSGGFPPFTSWNTGTSAHR